MCLRKDAQNRHFQSNTVHKAIPDFCVRMFFCKIWPTNRCVNYPLDGRQPKVDFLHRWAVVWFKLSGKSFL